MTIPEIWHPSLFKAPMVCAIRTDTKDVTRRLIKPQPDEDGLTTDTMRHQTVDRDDTRVVWAAIRRGGYDRMLTKVGLDPAKVRLRRAFVRRKQKPKTEENTSTTT